MAKLMRPTKEKLASRMAANRTGSSGFFKPKAGSNYIRILPGLEGMADEGTFLGACLIHSIGGGNNYREFRCLADTGKWCPICTTYKALETAGDSETAKSIAPRGVYFMNIIVRNDPEQKIRLWKAGYKQLEELLTYFEDLGDFTDPKTGYYVNIRKSGQGKGTRYKISPTQKKLKLPSWVNLDEAHDLLSSKVTGKETTESLVSTMIDRYGDALEDLETALAEARTRSIRAVKALKAKKESVSE
jgi:hypothetical protein